MYQNHINHKQNKRTLTNMAISTLEIVGFIALFVLLYVELWAIMG